MTSHLFYDNVVVVVVVLVVIVVRLQLFLVSI